MSNEKKKTLSVSERIKRHEQKTGKKIQRFRGTDEEKVLVMQFLKEIRENVQNNND
jgi:hypothetical protein